MTSQELIRWSRLHERRARTVPALAIPVAGGVLLAAWVAWRATTSTTSGSHAWLAGTMLAYAVAFMRVPFHIYWRADAPLLAQLPIEGRPLFDAAVARCVRAAVATTIAVVIGALPLALGADGALVVARHVAYAVTLGLAAALLLPGVTIGAAALVVQGGGATALRTATALAGAPARVSSPSRPAAVTPANAKVTPANAKVTPANAKVTPANAKVTPAAAPVTPPSSPAAILGALPGFAASVVIVALLFAAPWLLGEPASAPAPIVLGAVAVISFAAAIAARAGADVMGRVLRDVSALDRQRLATLEIKPPTPIEQLIARATAAAALPYGKDARLMRRRYPMAYALGALVFVILVIVGIATPNDPTPWLTIAIGGAAIYGLVLATRLRRPPIELARLSATLPLTTTASARAKLAWLLGWWSIFVAAPAVFAALRQTDSTIGLALTGAATLALIVASARPR